MPKSDAVDAHGVLPLAGELPPGPPPMARGTSSASLIDPRWHQAGDRLVDHGALSHLRNIACILGSPSDYSILCAIYLTAVTNGAATNVCD